MKIDLNGLVGLVVRIDGVTLSTAQLEVAWPHVQAYHQRQLTKSQMSARVRSACAKAGVPLEIEEDEDEVV